MYILFYFRLTFLSGHYSCYQEKNFELFFIIFFSDISHTCRCYVYFSNGNFRYWQAASYRRNFEVFSVNVLNQRTDRDKISHEKSYALHTHSVKFSWISVNSNTVCCGGKLIGVRGTFWGNTGLIIAAPFWKCWFKVIFLCTVFIFGKYKA